MNYLKELFSALAAMIVVVGGIYAITVWSVAKADSIEENTRSIDALRLEVSRNTEGLISLQRDVETIRQDLEILQKNVEQGFATIDEGFKSITESVAEIKILLTNTSSSETEI